MKAFGLDIIIESHKGTVRYGKEWAQLMRNDYGYIDNTIAVDGDELDCFIGNNLSSSMVYIIRQINPRTFGFDEYKVMLGFNDSIDANRAYHANYQLGWKGFGGMEAMNLIEFKNWYAEMAQDLHANA